MSEITRYSLFAGVRTDMAGEFMEYKDHAAVLATHATALATVQAEHRIALQQRDQVTKELEGVRKVEAWVQAGNTPGQPEHNLCGFAAGYFGAVIRRGMREEAVARGRTLAALGHALPDDTAQEGR